MTNEEKTRLLDSISSLEKEVEVAQQNLKDASAQRAYAEEAENQILAEVKSLVTLIEIRRKRLGLHADDPSAKSKEQPRLPLETPLQGSSSHAADGPDEDHSGEEVSKVNWIFNFVAGNGPRGAMPPEVARAASTAGVSMHPNYPYTALRKLVERGVLVKRRGRYYKNPA
jgi:alanine racemase